MKKLLLISTMLLLSTAVFAAEAPGILFCETFGDDWKPVKQGTEFTTSTVSFIASMGKPIGSAKVQMSIYKVAGAEEKLVQRNDVEINPTWDVLGIRKLALPEDGQYHIVLTTQDGAPLQDGKINVATAPKANAAEKPKAPGSNVQQLFNKYAPKQ